MAAGQALRRIFESLGVGDRDSERAVAAMPFSRDDVTAGTESELQAVVQGEKNAVDLPQTIEESNYFANIVRRVAAGDAPRRIVNELERYLHHNPSRTWENSWVRFPARRLSRYAREIFDQDLLADKRDPRRGARRDRDRFFFEQQGETFLRIPISYLLKLSLADHLGSGPDLSPAIRETGIRLLGHFLNDNTSPETFSFHVLPLRAARGMGRDVAREMARRYLLSQLLTMYANRRFGLEASGQRAMIYFAPNPPGRQRQLNDCISDAFYRELMMSPCLSGWDDGEAKQSYMHLCHQALSRSQLNGVAKLREAGIIVNNLVVLPNVSNTSLANNGIHVSLGSRRLTEALRDPQSGIGAAEEKHAGDLAIKIVEHFLPLFVGLYSAAPYRFDFADFHPERVLGFLPHELDYTHLRMLWRRWRGKADLKVFGYPMTPFGPPWIDRRMSRLFRLRGDWVPDFRLLDYLAALMSTERSPALDGRLGNGDRLRADLASLGIFDERMALYQLYRLREFAVMGFSGFEGRHYSLFAHLGEDLGRAVDLQVLVTALAWKYMLRGRIAHEHIPDDPFIESERRQIFFAAAIGLPTVFLRRDTPNRLLHEILRRTTKTRNSRRYAGFLRVKLDDYLRALAELLNEEAADLIDMFDLRETMADLTERLRAGASHSAVGRLTAGILADERHASPMRVRADEFNAQAEAYYRGPLRERHMQEGFDGLVADLREWLPAGLDDESRAALRECLGERAPADVVADLRDAAVYDFATEAEIRTLLSLTLLAIRRDARLSERMLHEGSAERSAASVH